MAETIPAGARLLSIPLAGQKLCRSKSWVWAKIKDDQEFPKPIRLGNQPVLLEHELDAYIALQIEKARAPDTSPSISPLAERLLKGRGRAKMAVAKEAEQ